MVNQSEIAAARWNQEYERGKYHEEPAIPFTQEIIETVQAYGLQGGRGLYIGCGNGRNYVPLFESGLKITGLDISSEAISQVAARCPEAQDALVCASFNEYEPAARFDYIVAIQVFQHGNSSQAVEYFNKSARLLNPGGLLCVRVNATSTDIYHEHTAEEEGDAGGQTIRYTAGPKAGIDVHFYTDAELHALTIDNFTVINAPKEVFMQRSAPQGGRWSQWEAMWQRR